jgi:hypothetical protein
MATMDISGSEALRRLQRNRASRWSSGWEQTAAPGTAWDRLQEPLFTPEISPRFSIERTDSVFAIGSCFAREIETRLAAIGFDVASRTRAFERFGPPQVEAWPFGYANKYNPFAILNELRWALDPTCTFPDAAIVEIGPGEWHDPHAHPIFGRLPLQTALDQHTTLTNLTAGITSCRVVVITLGLIEAWFDTRLGLYANSTPWLVQHVQDRYRFRVLDHREVMDALHAVHSILSKFGHREVEIVVTVSPVPLEATFTGEDIVIANMHSKSLLRTAASEWAAGYRNVHYFPSYEIATNSDRNATWHLDGRHVRADAVAHILDVFARAYVIAEATHSDGDVARAATSDLTLP